ncbi:hypothetical protein [Paracraurococcus ruber]|uniref:Uncharacterized protein n=1 Tax=Paracraurococcus ruber TaxID=77675 RepID=A0ABS1D6Y7_9PROT|nr:hypothetical protein [Paracraurococcus ruber]MBK1662564.1 hypothetical protein [Paracraurococcus ruber]TDG07446.1 hypothetical protein E2C05_31510 [Paracraurococcus ruber]
MPRPIRIARADTGALTYLVPLPPERLPAVRPADLLSAWSLARRAAALEMWGPPRLLRFARPEAEVTEIAIADADAGCWAEAVDSGFGLGSLTGMALCLRLLALVEVLARVRALAPLFDVTTEGIDLHPALLDAAASMPLDAGARFDEAAMRRLLSRRVAPGPERRRIA